jgi:hypothetical protein
MSFWSWFNDAFDVGAAMQPLQLVRTVPAPSRDEFAAWRDDPTTQFVMAALRRNADECRDEWLRQSWESGNADQRALDGLRERSDALLGFTADYEAFCETLNLEPEQEELAA